MLSRAIQILGIKSTDEIILNNLKCVEIPTEVQILDWTSIFEFSINIVQKIEYNLKHLAA